VWNQNFTYGVQNTVLKYCFECKTYNWRSKENYKNGSLIFDSDASALAERMTLCLIAWSDLQFNRFKKFCLKKKKKKKRKEGIRPCYVESILWKRENGFQKCIMCIGSYNTCVLHGIVQSQESAQINTQINREMPGERDSV